MADHTFAVPKKKQLPVVRKGVKRGPNISIKRQSANVYLGTETPKESKIRCSQG